MKLYAETPARRTRQIIGDLVLVGWVLTWAWVAGVVRDATMLLARPGEQIERAASGLANGMRDAGDAVSGVPLVGDEVRRPFDGAGGSADELAAAGASQVAAVEELAFWLFLVVLLVPTLIALAAYLPHRVRFVRRSTAGQRFVDSGGDLDLFALRAMAGQPLHRLARISDDPAGAWRAGDRTVIRQLAVLELRDAGMGPPPT